MSLLTAEVNFEKNVAELKDLSDDISHDILKLKQKYTFEVDKFLQEENNTLRNQISKMNEDFQKELNKIKFFNNKLQGESFTLDEIEQVK